MSFLAETIALICLIWSLAVVFVTAIGISAVYEGPHAFLGCIKHDLLTLVSCRFRYYSQRPQPSVSSKLDDNAPHVTIIRPAKGLEPQLYECLASTFQQDYPADRLSIRLCVDSLTDPAYPILKKLIHDFPKVDAKVLVESADPQLHGPNGNPESLGPNPKIRNISRAYREAKGDIIWIIDCNVWVSTGVLGRTVDKLMGYQPGTKSAKPYKFVHHLPLVVDIVDYGKEPSAASQALLSSGSEASASTFSIPKLGTDLPSRVVANGGGRLDEMFMSTSHAKFYAAINAVGIAPCIVGKSNMFRKSHLNSATDPTRNLALPKDDARQPGINYFSFNICEDHLIGDILWRSDIPGHANHGLVWGDLVVQPMAGMTLAAYVARRVRWLRARKFTVLAATLVEPGVESLVCCAYLAFAVTTLPYFHKILGLPQTWLATILCWIALVLLWMQVDRTIYHRLQSARTIETDPNTPFFATGILRQWTKRSYVEWVLAWLGREAMALPIWTWAVLLGMTVNWRGQTFTVRLDTTVIVSKVASTIVGSGGSRDQGISTPELERAGQESKDRLD